jgi:serine/threonine protein kinase
MPWWTRHTSKEKLIIITDWMACLASGLSALHKEEIKHQDIKPENVLFDASLLPVISNFKVAHKKKVRFQDSCVYFPPEQLNGKFGRKSDIFSLGLVFVELALLYFGQKSLKEEFSSRFYGDVTNNLEDFLAKKFALMNHSILDDWIKRFQGLILIMLAVAPESRPDASEVWKEAKRMVESLGAKTHCENVSPVKSIIQCEHNELENDMELHLSENLSRCVV